MKNIHILPTDKPSKLYVRNDVTPPFYSNFQGEPLNIYITSDEEIKEGDWCLCSEELIHKVVEIKSNIGIIRFQDGDTEVLDACKKIILTTDVDLIKDGIQAIDNDFLEWFVKNPSCEEVKVVLEKHSEDEWIDDDFGGETYTFEYENYKIIIPKEKHKQETLEEVIERLFRYYPESSGYIKAALIGKEWQQERSYSEEEVENILIEYVKTNPSKPYRVVSWFTQFKRNNK